ncbi:EGR1 [Lepeophtheirus salmonis]|uniref:EGR1 n=1 Tax=Lepeophtheirus salmonis TaxID=72036 RepID=A0A7R8CZ31_LEPSM|nr:EGR1 [Lepeophtheirus salmonis]CAF2929633.1 EGR1 [Lepeophtheirus salmonis]
MKHFKEKIDKIFPHCRPYACPTGDCPFTGKDKQALLRHYTGKHGILDKYLREALAEKGINYSHESSKRKHHHTNNNVDKSKHARLSPPVHPSTSSVPTTLFIPASVPNDHHNNSIILQSRPNTEELKKEVEAMMATFQPVEPSQVVLFSSGASPPQDHPVTTHTPPQDPSPHHRSPYHSGLPPTSTMLSTSSSQPILHDSVTCILPDSPPAEDTLHQSIVEPNLGLDAITLPALLAASPKAPSLVLNPSQRVLQQIQHPPNEKIPLPSIRTIVSQVPLDMLPGNSYVTTTSSLSAVDQAAASVVSSITTPISLATCHLDHSPTVENGEKSCGAREQRVRFQPLFWSLIIL